MVKFYLGEGNLTHVQNLLDIWSKQHPYASLDDIDMDCIIDSEGKWHIVLVYEDTV